MKSLKFLIFAIGFTLIANTGFSASIANTHAFTSFELGIEDEDDKKKKCKKECKDKKSDKKCCKDKAAKSDKTDEAAAKEKPNKPKKAKKSCAKEDQKKPCCMHGQKK